MIDRIWVRIRCIAGILYCVLTGTIFMLTKAEWAGIWKMLRTGQRVPRPKSTDLDGKGQDSNGND